MLSEEKKKEVRDTESKSKFPQRQLETDQETRKRLKSSLDYKKAKRKLKLLRKEREKGWD